MQPMNKRIRSYQRAGLCFIILFTLLLLLTVGSQKKFGTSVTCLPRKKIAFLKTHKCASSTIQNILFRYGDTHHLKFVFPLKGNYLGRSQYFNRSMVSSVPWHSLGYDIFALHTMWNANEINAALGASQDDIVVISIIRDPVDLFESLYSFAQWDRLFRMDINKFARVINFNTNRSTDFLSVGGYTGHNQMLHDFGLPDENTSSLNMVKAKIKQIESEFDLIMVAEQIDESLVLLQHLLCWNLEDVTSLPINERQDFYRQNLDPETRTLLRRWLWADQMLYDHFKHVFQMKKLKFGIERLQFEANKLRTMNAEVKESCGAIEGNYKNLKGEFKPSNSRVKGFSVKHECESLARSELAYIDLLRQRQLAYVNSTTRQSTPDMI